MSPKRPRRAARERGRRAGSRGAETLLASDYPHFETLCRGYLHQDMLAEHGSLLGAVEAFLADVAPEDVEAVAAESERMLTSMAMRPLDSIQRTLSDQFRSSWRPERPGDVVVVLERLRDARHRRRDT